MKRSLAPSQRAEDLKRLKPLPSEDQSKSDADATKAEGTLPPSTPSTTSQPRKKFLSPMMAVASPSITTSVPSSPDVGFPSPSRYWKVFHCKRSNKKHKTYEDGTLISVFLHFPMLFTGVLICKAAKCILKDMEGKEQGVTSQYSLKTLQTLVLGSTLLIGSRELEVANTFFVASLSHGFGRFRRNCQRRSILAVLSSCRRHLPPASVHLSHNTLSDMGCLTLLCSCQATPAHAEVP